MSISLSPRSSAACLSTETCWDRSAGLRRSSSPASVAPPTWIQENEGRPIGPDINKDPSFDETHACGKVVGGQESPRRGSVPDLNPAHNQATKRACTGQAFRNWRERRSNRPRYHPTPQPGVPFARRKCVLVQADISGYGLVLQRRKARRRTSRFRRIVAGASGSPSLPRLEIAA
jgi:hypothetical protein